jgi:hypothetical protein
MSRGYPRRFWPISVNMLELTRNDGFLMHNYRALLEKVDGRRKRQDQFGPAGIEK